MVDRSQSHTKNEITKSNIHHFKDNQKQKTQAIQIIRNNPPPSKKKVEEKKDHIFYIQVLLESWIRLRLKATTTDKNIQDT